jgi:DNA-binding MarR family transcriptional regulator
MGRSARKQATPDLGVLAARLLFGLQAELFHRAAEQGFDDVRPRHGTALAYLDEDGIRLGDLARQAGRNKQTIAAILDELEKLGYTYRAADPADRRAKLIIPTDRGRQLMQISDEIVADIEERHAAKLGRAAYADFIQVLRAITGNGMAVEE